MPQFARAVAECAASDLDNLPARERVPAGADTSGAGDAFSWMLTAMHRWEEPALKAHGASAAKD